MYGFPTARAAWTLLTYLTEINKAGASFFSEYMAANPIPYHYGAEAKIVDVSGESFILGLMTMTPVNIDEKFRNNYITVDPPALAVRLLDIRLALHDEFVADLSHVREENADIMKVACLSNLEGSMKMECDVVFGDRRFRGAGGERREDGWGGEGSVRPLVTRGDERVMGMTETAPRERDVGSGVPRKNCDLNNTGETDLEVEREEAVLARAPPARAVPPLRFAGGLFARWRRAYTASGSSLLSGSRRRAGRRRHHPVAARSTPGGSPRSPRTSPSSAGSSAPRRRLARTSRIARTSSPPTSRSRVACSTRPPGRCTSSASTSAWSPPTSAQPRARARGARVRRGPGERRGRPYMPHLSLVYGDLDASERRAAAEARARELLGDRAPEADSSRRTSASGARTWRTMTCATWSRVERFPLRFRAASTDARVHRARDGREGSTRAT